jgi:glycosyltransferase involved in cell wall biosynthesis
MPTSNSSGLDDSSFPTVSVIVPTRNRLELLRETIQSLLAQSYEAFEVIVVSDASTDGTNEYMARLARENDVIRFIAFPEAKGAPAARNAGERIAKGSFLLFNDDDCISKPERLRVLAEALDRHPEAAFVHCWMESIEVDGSCMIYTGNGGLSAGTPYAMMRRDAFQQAGGFDPDMPRLQDFDLWIRVLTLGAAVKIPTVLFRTYRDPQGISSQPARFRAAGRRILEKYPPGSLPPSHLRAVFRNLAIAALRLKCYRIGVRCQLRALSAAPADPVSWAHLIAALPGPGIYLRLLAFWEKFLSPSPS